MQQILADLCGNGPTRKAVISNRTLNKVDTKLMVLPKCKRGGWQERARKETEQERRGTDVDMLEMA